MTMKVTMIMMMHLLAKFFKNYDYYRMQVPARQLSAMHYFWQNKKTEFCYSQKQWKVKQELTLIITDKHQ